VLRAGCAPSAVNSSSAAVVSVLRWQLAGAAMTSLPADAHCKQTPPCEHILPIERLWKWCGAELGDEGNGRVALYTLVSFGMATAVYICLPCAVALSSSCVCSGKYCRGGGRIVLLMVSPGNGMLPATTAAYQRMMVSLVVLLALCLLQCSCAVDTQVPRLQVFWWVTALRCCVCLLQTGVLRILYFLMRAQPLVLY
jgi:hypothetical protein